MPPTPTFTPTALPRKRQTPHNPPLAKRRRTPAMQTFSPAPYRPYPTSNPHIQTILAHFYPSSPAPTYTRRTLPSADGLATLQIDVAGPYAASLLAHASPPPRPSRHAPLPARAPPLAVVLHGLESNSTSNMSLRIVSAMRAAGFEVAVLNFRCCADGDDVPTTLRLYHAGFTEDVETLLKAFRDGARAASVTAPEVYMCGFSLGANVLCQFLGRWGTDVGSSFGVVAAAGACVPFDPVACQKRLDGGWRGLVYSRRLVETMQTKFRRAVEAGVDLGACVPEKVAKADRVGLIDDALIAPVFGFKDPMDYYQKVDSRKVLKNIAVPTLLINARDDPFFDHASGRSLPTREQVGDAPVLLHLTEHGGHCAFLDKEGFFETAPCYFQREFARFFSHVRNAPSNPLVDANANLRSTTKANLDPNHDTIP